ncbi:hypothetical protein MUP95_09175 [bacterium]|nr:hypothetical protein [bacterium]
MISSKIAAVGDFDSVTLFKSMGVHVYTVEDDVKGKEHFIQVLKQGFDVVFLTERLGEKWSDVLKEVDVKRKPTVILVPDQKGSTGFAWDRIRGIVKKAVGADILKEKGKA